MNVVKKILIASTALLLSSTAIAHDNPLRSKKAYGQNVKKVQTKASEAKPYKNTSYKKKPVHTKKKIAKIEAKVKKVTSQQAAYDYDADYYEDEGALLFKVRAFYTSLSGKMKNLPNGNLNTEKPGALSQHGYGFDTATTYFFTDNIAAELSLGISTLRVKKNTLLKASLFLGDGTGTTGKNNDIFWVPLAATVQYHVAPFGAIRPYIGGGYSGSYMHTNSKAIKVANGHGPVVQAGVDFVSKDDTLFTFDVRQYFLKSKVTFKKGFLRPGGGTNANDINSKVDWNPLVISAGFGFKF